MNKVTSVFNLVHAYKEVSGIASLIDSCNAFMGVGIAMSRLYVCCQARACPPWHGGRSSLASLDVLSTSLGSRVVQLDGQ